jgi:hypothetical protein
MRRGDSTVARTSPSTTRERRGRTVFPMDPVTMIGLIAVAGMFSTGVTLVWLGLRNRPDRLPSGADAVLAAVMDGRLARPDHSIDLVHPPTVPPRAAQPTPAVRVLAEEDAQSVDEPAAPAPTAETPRPQSQPEPEPEPAAKPEPASEPVPVAAAPRPTAELDDALFGGVDDPSVAGAREFFAEKPALQRF